MGMTAGRVNHMVMMILLAVLVVMMMVVVVVRALLLVLILLALILLTIVRVAMGMIMGSINDHRLEDMNWANVFVVVDDDRPLGCLGRLGLGRVLWSMMSTMSVTLVVLFHNNDHLLLIV